MYVAVDFKKETIFLLGIGTKESQARDINDAKELLRSIKIGGVE
jgi:hypothetical protein